MTTENTEIEVVMNSLESIERAQIDVQIATAKRYPRVMKQVKDEMIELATMDRETAEACFYSVPRGDKSIKGPSVRLAEIAVSAYGNIRVQSRVLETVTEGDNPHVVVQSTCADLQRNVAVSIEKRRAIRGKKRNNGKPDEDDITLATNACSAIAFRDAAYKVIPGALVQSAFRKAMEVAIGTSKTLVDRRAEVLLYSSKVGVSEKRVLAMLNLRTSEEIGLDELGTLQGVFNSIKDGNSNVDDIFPPETKPLVAVDTTDSQREVALAAAKANGVEVTEGMDTAAIYDAIKEAGKVKTPAKEEVQQEEKPAESKPDQESEKPKADPKPAPAKTDKALRQKTLEDMAKKLDQADLTLTCNNIFKEHTAVEKAAYLKMCKIDQDADLNVADIESLRKLYVMLKAEEMQKEDNAVKKDDTEGFNFD